MTLGFDVMAAKVGICFDLPLFLCSETFFKTLFNKNTKKIRLQRTTVTKIYYLCNAKTAKKNLNQNN